MQMCLSLVDINLNHRNSVATNCAKNPDLRLHYPKPMVEPIGKSKQDVNPAVQAWKSDKAIIYETKTSGYDKNYTVHILQSNLIIPD